jgi:chromosome segregation ATPase
VQATIATHEKEHEEEIDILEEEVDRLNKKYNAEKARAKQLEIKFGTEVESKEKEYVQNLKTAWDQVRDEKAKNEQLSKLVENLRAENEELKVDVEELQTGECDGCEKWEAEYEALQEENIELDSACEELNETNEQLVTRKAHLAEELEEEKAETAHYKQKYEQALAANTNAVQLQQLLDYEKEVKQQLYDHLQTANATIQSLKEQLHTLQAQFDHDKETKEQLLVHVNNANASLQQYQAEAQQIINAKDWTVLEEQSKAVSLRVQLQAVTVELEKEKKTREEQVGITRQHTDAQVAELRQIIKQERQRSSDFSAVVAHLDAQLSTANDENSGLSGQLAALQQVTAKHQEKSTGLVAASLSVYERANQPEARIQTLETLLAAVSVPVPADVYERAKEPLTRLQTLETLLAAASVPLPAEKKKKKQKKAKKEEGKKQQPFFMLPLCTFFDEDDELCDELCDEGFLPDAPPLEPSFSSSYPFPSSSPYPASAAPSTLPSSPPAPWFS